MQFLLQFVLDICDTYNAILYDLLKDARFLIACGIVQYCINKKANTNVPKLDIHNRIIAEGMLEVSKQIK